MHLLKVFLPNYNCLLSDFRAKNLSVNEGNVGWKGPLLSLGGRRRGLKFNRRLFVWQHGNFDICVI